MCVIFENTFLNLYSNRCLDSCTRNGIRRRVVVQRWSVGFVCICSRLKPQNLSSQRLFGAVKQEEIAKGCCWVILDKITHSLTWQLHMINGLVLAQWNSCIFSFEHIPSCISPYHKMYWKIPCISKETGN